MIATINGNAEQTAQFMKYGDKPGAHIATNVALTNVKKGCDAGCVHKLISDSVAISGEDDLWPNWQVLCLPLFLLLCAHLMMEHIMLWCCPLVCVCDHFWFISHCFLSQCMC